MKRIESIVFNKNSLIRNILTTRESSGTIRRPLPRQILIPTESITREETKGLLVKTFSGKLSVPRHLLWHLLFKNITVIDWFLLLKYLELNLKGSNELFNACLAGVLSLSSSTRIGLKDREDQLKPIHKKLLGTPKWDPNLKETLLDCIIRILGVPQKGMPLDQIRTIGRITRKNPRPLPVNRIGVGYKDHGSMGPDRPESPPDDLEVISSNFNEKSVFELWDSIFSLFSTNLE